ncbi:MAG: hypothetical protein M0R80_02325 [Proteobacteria bacterium]|jgi:hypothetical protein|nr:hypothetical protein [Pseudomonadota bacterium]
MNTENIAIVITQSLNNQGIEITPGETKNYLPDDWYLLPLDEMENYVFMEYLVAESKKDRAENLSDKA